VDPRSPPADPAVRRPEPALAAGAGSIAERLAAGAGGIAERLAAGTGSIAERLAAGADGDSGEQPRKRRRGHSPPRRRSTSAGGTSPGASRPSWRKGRHEQRERERAGLAASAAQRQSSHATKAGAPQLPEPQDGGKHKAGSRKTRKNAHRSRSRRGEGHQRHESNGHARSREQTSQKSTPADRSSIDKDLEQQNKICDTPPLQSVSDGAQLVDFNKAETAIDSALTRTPAPTLVQASLEETVVGQASLEETVVQGGKNASESVTGIASAALHPDSDGAGDADTAAPTPMIGDSATVPSARTPSTEEAGLANLEERAATPTVTAAQSLTQVGNPTPMNLNPPADPLKAIHESEICTDVAGNELADVPSPVGTDAAQASAKTYLETIKDALIGVPIEAAASTPAVTTPLHAPATEPAEVCAKAAADELSLGTANAASTATAEMPVDPSVGPPSEAPMEVPVASTVEDTACTAPRENGKAQSDIQPHEAAADPGGAVGNSQVEMQPSVCPTGKEAGESTSPMQAGESRAPPLSPELPPAPAGKPERVRAPKPHARKPEEAGAAVLSSPGRPAAPPRHAEEVQQAVAAESAAVAPQAAAAAAHTETPVSAQSSLFAGQAAPEVVPAAVPEKPAASASTLPPPDPILAFAAATPAVVAAAQSLETSVKQPVPRSSGMGGPRATSSARPMPRRDGRAPAQTPPASVLVIAASANTPEGLELVTPFVAENGIDWAAEAVLLSLPEELRNGVIGEGPCFGPDIPASLLLRIRSRRSAIPP